MGWLITLGVLVLLAITPVGVHFKYNSEGIVLRVICGLLRITLLPRNKKQKTEEKKPKPKKEKPPKEKKEPVSPKPEQEKGGSITDFVPLVKLALNFLNDFRRKLRVDVLELKLIMAGGDPCNLAINYGRAWAAVGNLMPHLDRLFVIKKRDIEVECDFTGTETLIIAHLDLTITLGRILSLVTVYAIRAIKELLNIKKKRKGGAAK
jgi:hypothetical protein